MKKRASGHPLRGKRKAEAENPSGQENFYEAMKDYLGHLETLNYSQRTVQCRREYLKRFFEWSGQRGLGSPWEVSKAVLESYQRHLHRQSASGGERKKGRLSFSTQHKHLSGLKNFFRWLCRKGRLPYNPASEIELPRLEQRLPREVLSAAEVEKVLGQADVSQALGLRDRAILEVLYATAMRRGEALKLELRDLQKQREVIVIRCGKGKKDRVVPVTGRAMKWLENYLEKARPKLEGPGSGQILFLTEYGQSITPDRLSGLVSGYIEAAKLGKRGSCHLLRHTCATLMHENGADIRYIQQLLGHKNLETTEIYTQVAIRQLKAVHALTHPGNLAGNQGAAPHLG